MSETNSLINQQTIQRKFLTNINISDNVLIAIMISIIVLFVLGLLTGSAVGVYYSGKARETNKCEDPDQNKREKVCPLIDAGYYSSLVVLIILCVIISIVVGFSFLALLSS
jgi:hypothetical protein